MQLNLGRERNPNQPQAIQAGGPPCWRVGDTHKVPAVRVCHLMILPDDGQRRSPLPSEGRLSVELVRA